MQQIFRSVFSATVFQLCLLLSFFSSTTITAQQVQQVNSPYSLFGLGDIQASTFAYNRAMGGTSAATRTPNNINYNNPASYTAFYYMDTTANRPLRFTTFETALQADWLWLNNEAGEQTFSGAANLAYLSLGLPVAKSWGLSMGLLPYSIRRYDLNTTTTTADIETINYRFTGEGQTYQAYFGGAYKYKNLSVGVNVGYLFGRLSKSMFQNFGAQNAFGNIRSEVLTPRGFIWNAGVQYDVQLKNKILTAGISGNTRIDLNHSQEQVWERVSVENEIPVNIADSVFYNSGNNIDGGIQIPLTLRAGLALRRDFNWNLTADITYQQWSQANYLGAPANSAQDALIFAIGFDYIPNVRAVTKFWKSTAYRTGFYYNTGNLNINNTNISEFAFSAGFGLPIRRNASRLNLTYEIGRRGTLENNLVQQNFMRATIGFTLNDTGWFYKRKYD